jgi:Fur family ferric uptake transcriptional regulator
MSCEESFYKQLRKRGFRLTPQRELVLSAVHALEGLSTADDILSKVQEVTSSVDRSTVYRTLELLQDFHVVASMEGSDGQRRYELLSNGSPHVHLVCRCCGKVLGTDLEGFEPFMEQVEQRYGFHVGVEHLSIAGLCQDCCASGGEGDIISS